jgi:hypothetical protein
VGWFCFSIDETEHPIKEALVSDHQPHVDELAAQVRELRATLQEQAMGSLIGKVPHEEALKTAKMLSNRLYDWQKARWPERRHRRVPATTLLRNLR